MHRLSALRGRGCPKTAECPREAHLPSGSGLAAKSREWRVAHPGSASAACVSRLRRYTRRVRVPAPAHEDFVSAALRHIRDAEHLAGDGPAQSLDQAWHLAGFAHECGRKACLGDGWIARLLGHDFSSASETIVEWAIALDPHAGLFPVRDWSRRHPAVRSWRAEHRYERTGTAQVADVTVLVQQGRAAVDECLVALLEAGQVSLESLA